MPRGRLLEDVGEINYQELVGNGRRYLVPPYQRDYSWRKEHWEDLWSDLMALRANCDERHYMGAIVIATKGEREAHIIDGQQRFATLSVLALAVIDSLQGLAEHGLEPEPNRSRATELRNRFIGEKDPASLVERSRLVLNVADNPFYQQYLVRLATPPNPRGLTGSNRLLWECFGYFRDQLHTIGEWARDGRQLAELISEVISLRLAFLRITVDDEVKAYTVFETLNARGLELTTIDLLKNYLFSLVSEFSDLHELQVRWQRLLATVGAERFPELLRYHMQCEHAKIRSPQLFRLIRSKVQSGGQAFDLMDALERRAELYNALSDPGHGYWYDLPEARRWVQELVLLGVRQMTPLLFAVWEKMDRRDFVSVLRTVVMVTFRYTIVSQLNPNELEAIYHQAAKAVLTGGATSPAQVFEYIRPLYVIDDKFRLDFSVLSIVTRGQKKKIARYVLAALETQLGNHHCDPESDPGTIEHIYPESPTEVWQGEFGLPAAEQLIYRIGNLTLLDASTNRRVGNADYGTKVEAYAQSKYALTRQIAEVAPEEWSPARLERRQKQLAALACQVWRVDH